jgi:hypothetical protein
MTWRLRARTSGWRVRVSPRRMAHQKGITISITQPLGVGVSYPPSTAHPKSIQLPLYGNCINSHDQSVMDVREFWLMKWVNRRGTTLSQRHACWETSGQVLVSGLGVLETRPGTMYRGGKKSDGEKISL